MKAYPIVSKQFDRFGYSVALSTDGNTCAIGVYSVDSDEDSDVEAVYIFTRSENTWIQQAKLFASDKTAEDQFGYSIALSADGNTCAVGAYMSAQDNVPNAGAVYIFTRSGDTWIEQAKLIASDKSKDDFFGCSVALSADGNTCAVGADLVDCGNAIDVGAVYIFTRSGSVWNEQAKLFASDKAVGNCFGFSVALSADGNICAIGSNLAASNGVNSTGAVYIFARSENTWIQQTKLFASDESADVQFGSSVALSADGTTVAIGAHMANLDGLKETGAVYIFTRSEDIWIEQAKLIASDRAARDWFGWPISLSTDGNTCAVGASLADPDGVTDAGAVYIFTRFGDTWTEQVKLTALEKTANNYFGSSIALSGDGKTCIIGSYGSNPVIAYA